jgi:hypothetical protein
LIVAERPAKPPPRLPQHLDRHAVFCRRLKNELGIASTALDFLAEVGTEFLEMI